MTNEQDEKNLFDPERWGLPLEGIETLPEKLHGHWERFRECFTTRTRDTSEHAYQYMRGLLTMETGRNFASIARTLEGQDGQAMQHFMSNSPWSGPAVYERIQEDICATSQLAVRYVTTPGHRQVGQTTRHFNRNTSVIFRMDNLSCDMATSPRGIAEGDGLPHLDGIIRRYFAPH